MTYGSTDVSQIQEDDEDISIVFGNPDKRNRNFNRKASVILPRTGERVHRQLSFNTSYESFEPNETGSSTNGAASEQNGGTISVGDAGDEADETTPLFSDVSLSNKLRLLVYHIYHTILSINNENAKNILKCSFAYSIASLGVYYAPFNNLMGSSDFKHVIATVVVYFHPSRTKGSMHITLVYVIISLVYSFTISFVCRYLSASFYNNGSEEVSYAIDLVISSVSLGIVSFMKQKVNKETFNTACSLASISIVACVIKEGSMNGAIIPIGRLVATLRIVVVGCLISVTVCYLLWPKSAEHILISDLNDTYTTMSSLLSVLANRFLQGEKLNGLDNEVFNKLNNKIKSLNVNLKDSKYEMFLTGREAQWHHLNGLVDITVGLTKHLKALRSSTEMQWELLHENDGEILARSGTLNSLDSFSSSNLAVSESIENLTKINEQSASAEVDYVAINSSQMFDLFVYYLAPSTKAFIFTIKNILNDLPCETTSGGFGPFIRTAKYQKSLKIALKLFDDKQVQSFKKLYDQDRFKANSDFLFNSDLEEVTACCGNFSSLLKYFGEELLEFLQVLEQKPTAAKSWGWIKFWKKKNNDQKDSQKEYSSDLNDALFYLQNQYNLKTVNRDNINVENSTVNYYSFKLWQVLKIFKRTDIQFGIRVGLGAFMLSLFAFYPKTKFLFNNWRGEWSLTIYCIMMNKSLGGTQMTVKWRFLGTFLGAAIAWVVWLLFDGHPLALWIAGFALSIPCFYIIIYWKNTNAFGRFILLTYNLTALYSYTMEKHDSEDDNEGGDTPIISEIAFHRFISVSIGVIWALTMASVFIPNSARSRLKSGLTILWLRIGVIWNSDPLDYHFDESDQKYKLISLKGGENSLNSILAELEVLIKQAPLEFRIKGKFPQKKYEALIKSTSKIIDALHNMILIIEVDPILSQNEEFVINYIEAERHELEHRIFLIFYMIASSMKLQFPLPSKPASTEHAKDRLLYKLSQVRTNSIVGDSVVLSNEDYVLLYSYILVTNVLTEELDKIIEIIKELMGDINEEVFQLV